MSQFRPPVEPLGTYQECPTWDTPVGTSHESLKDSTYGIWDIIETFWDVPGMLSFFWVYTLATTIYIHVNQA